MKMAVQFWLNQGVRRGVPGSSAFGTAITATRSARCRSAILMKACTRCFRDVLPQQMVVDLPRDEAADFVRFGDLLADPCRRDRGRDLWSRWFRRPAA